MIAPIVLSLLAATAQQPGLAGLPEGCPVKTFGVVIPAGWFATQIQDPPEGREGCLFILFREDKSPAATIHVESGSATLPLFSQPDPFQGTYEKIAEGLTKNMNVVLKRETYRNDAVKTAPNSPINKATMRVFAAEVPGNANAYEVVIAVMRAPERFFTVIVVTLAKEADEKVAEASHEAFRKVMNSLNPAPAKK